MRTKLLLLTVLILLALLLLMPAAADAAPAAHSGGVWHLVRRGETLNGISRLYGVPVSAIAGVNGIVNVNRIWAGTYLWIPTWSTPPHDPPGPTCRTKVTVRRGDTLGAIARYWGVSVWELARNNGICNVDLIFPGQRLCIPWSGVPR